MGTITMSTRERRRMVLMTRVGARQLKLREAGEMMQVSYRQAKRIVRRYREEGDSGLVHKGRGRRSNRARPEAERARILALYGKKYHGFGPLLASEHMATDNEIVVDHETLRRWLIAEGQWSVRRQQEKHRAARERRPQRGDLVQIDGSEHDWFEGRGPRAVLMVMIDDATNTTLARFYPAEDTASAYDLFHRYVHQYGLPAALYPDRDSIYVCTLEANLEEQLADRGPETQFGRAMRELGVELIPAHSPQAKGRVERRHELFQDRLVKEMRLLGIHTIAAANVYLDSTFLAFLNQRYTVRPRDALNGHRACPSEAKLALVLSWQDARIVAKDWTVRWRNRRIQIDARHSALGLPGRRVQVVERRDGSLVVIYGKRILTTRKAPAPAVPAHRAVLRPAWPRRPRTPAADHPWRHSVLTRSRSRLSRPPPTSYAAHSRGAERPAAATALCLATTN